MSKAARVKSQWEKTVQGTAKSYLEEIHQQAMAERNVECLSSSSLAAAIKSGTSTREHTNSLSSTNDDHKINIDNSKVRYYIQFLNFIHILSLKLLNFDFPAKQDGKDEVRSKAVN